MERLDSQGKETLEDYNYHNKRIADIILEKIADTTFTGMSVSTHGLATPILALEF